jgi:hypothetical protein
MKRRLPGLAPFEASRDVSSAVDIGAKADTAHW